MLYETELTIRKEESSETKCQYPGVYNPEAFNQVRTALRSQLITNKEESNLPVNSKGK